MNFYLKTYEELTKAELYTILRLRAEVFVVEQHCPFNDLDGLDEHSYHLQAFENEKLVGYSRIIFPGKLYEQPSIGRVVVDFEHRHSGHGKQVMQEALRQCQHLYPNLEIKIMAQQYLQGFYESFGFKEKGEPFLEDNIWHVDMLLS